MVSLLPTHADLIDAGWWYQWLECGGQAHVTNNHVSLRHPSVSAGVKVEIQAWTRASRLDLDAVEYAIGKACVRLANATVVIKPPVGVKLRPRYEQQGHFRRGVSENVWLFQPQMVVPGTHVEDRARASLQELERALG
jgi:hypothetical protein